MSNHQTHLDAAKQVCLTALHHLDHGCVVVVKQHSGSVVDEPGEPARIILTLELEALDLPIINEINREKSELRASLYGATREEISREFERLTTPTVRGVPFEDELLRYGVTMFGRGSRLATGEESGGESLHVVKDSEDKDRMVMASLESGPVVKAPALTRDDLVTIVYNAGLGLTTGRLDSMIDSIMLAQDKAIRGDE